MEKLYSGKTALIFLILTLVIYFFMVWVSMPMIGVYSDGLAILDMKSGGYDYAYVMNLLGTLGPEGRSVYIFPQLILDLIFPLIYGTFLVSTYGLLLKKSQKIKSVFAYGIFIPLLTVLADYCENISSIILLRTYPEISANLASFASVCTQIKSIALVLCFVLLIVGVIIFLLTKFRKRVSR